MSSSMIMQCCQSCMKLLECEALSVVPQPVPAAAHVATPEQVLSVSM
jgi:hypothetical protein